MKKFKKEIDKYISVIVEINEEIQLLEDIGLIEEKSEELETCIDKVREIIYDFDFYNFRGKAN